eukprot:TRINITY_DN19866_c0_g1_i1.p1 TRINITY_DN19866_c0_g1~~TRINITY_DN19866_c0_g1_i1.p1  ORF type:complete len:318 (+),score=113.58 TRINITY_DN19866_c0_g1_i1:103-954(+)
MAAAPVSPAPAVPAVPATPLITLCMEGRPLPAPWPPVTDPTPQEQYERAQQESDERARSLSRSAAEQQREAGKQETGFFGKVGAFAKAAGNQVQEAATRAHASTEASLRQQLADRDQKCFAQAFTDLGTSPQGQLVCAFSCKAMHQGMTVPGDVYLTATHVCFAAEKPLIRDAIPLANIASLQPSVVLPTSASGCGFQGGCVEDGPPYIIPCPGASVVPSCVQIFTTDGRIVQLLTFDNKKTVVASQLTSSVQGNAWGRFYNFLDHCWRKQTAVPVPGVQYVQ